MRIIFCDIDGVLLPAGVKAWPENRPLQAKPVAERIAHWRFERGPVGLLLDLAERTGARIVLHSDWRRSWPHPLAELRSKLEAEGLRADIWHEDWAAPVSAGAKKWDDLAAWLDQHPGVTAALVIGVTTRKCWICPTFENVW